MQYSAERMDCNTLAVAAAAQVAVGADTAAAAGHTEVENMHHIAAAVGAVAAAACALHTEADHTVAEVVAADDSTEG